MASDIPQVVISSPLTVELINTLAKGLSYARLLELGYSYWQVTTALREALEKGLVIQDGVDARVSDLGMQYASAHVVKASPKTFEALEHRRVAKLDKNAQYKIGRRALEQIRIRVST